MTRVVGLLLFGLVACGGRASEDKVDPRAADGFATALEATASVEPTRSAALLAQGAFETVAPSVKCLERFGAAATERARVEALLDCGLACTEDAVQKLKGVEPRTWMAALAAACDPAHFGLEKSEAAMLSPEWFLLHKIGELAGPHIAAAEGPVRARLEQAMAAFELPLPLPAMASGMFELPVAPAEVSVPVATRTYVIVPAKGELRAGASPHARLGARGAAMGAAEGRAWFPGNEVARADLKAIVLENAGVKAAAPPPDAGPPPADIAPAGQDAGAAPAPRGQYTMKGNRFDPQLAKRQAIENARAAGILGAMSKGGDATGFGGLGSLGLPPGLHGEVSMSLSGDLGRDGDPVPLILADGARPGVEVIEIAAAVPRVLVAVASPEESAARALAVELRSQLNSAGGLPGQAIVALAAGGLEAARKAAAGSEETVVIRVEEGVPWRDVVAVAAVAIARGAKQIVLTTPRLGGGTGSGGGLLGHGAHGQGKPALSLITDGTPVATGDLDENIIRRIMRSRLGVFRACYERELLVDPKLAGRVDLEFTIGADGAVTTAKGSGLEKVMDCVVEQVKLVKFPRPKGGGVVNVRYPLVFKPKDE